MSLNCREAALRVRFLVLFLIPTMWFIPKISSAAIIRYDFTIAEKVGDGTVETSGFVTYDQNPDSVVPIIPNLPPPFGDGLSPGNQFVYETPNPYVFVWESVEYGRVEGTLTGIRLEDISMRTVGVFLVPASDSVAFIYNIEDLNRVARALFTFPDESLDRNSVPDETLNFSDTLGPGNSFTAANRLTLFETMKPFGATIPGNFTSFQGTALPEPHAIALLALGMVGLAYRRSLTTSRQS